MDKTQVDSIIGQLQSEKAKLQDALNAILEISSGDDDDSVRFPRPVDAIIALGEIRIKSAAALGVCPNCCNSWAVHNDDGSCVEN